MLVLTILFVGFSCCLSVLFWGFPCSPTNGKFTWQVWSQLGVPPVAEGVFPIKGCNDGPPNSCKWSSPYFAAT